MTEVVSTPDEISDASATPDVAAPARGRVRRDESGLALVWMALFLMVLLGFAAIAVDIGHGYLVSQRAQNAADSAALAGTIYLPQDLAAAQDAAATVAASNGFTNGVNGVTVSSIQAKAVSQLKVTVKQDVPTWFARALGFKTMTISRSATADYRPPVAMGSPTSQYGNDPESAGVFGSTSYPNFWGNIAGPQSPKSNGDAYQGGTCGSADACTTPPSDTSCGYSGNNSDYVCDGYFYTIHLPSAAPSLKLQAFDPGFVHVGDTCGANDGGSNLQGADTLAKANVKGWPAGVADNLAARYKWVTDNTISTDPGDRYCTGDQSFGDPNITTTYTVLGPATVPGDPSSAPTTPLCTKSYPGFQGDLAAQLVSATKMAVTVNGAASPEYLGQYFRQWDNLCPGTGKISAVAGDYFIEMQTNLTTTGQSTTAGNGHNRFALRATGGSGVGIYGNGKMGIYANVGGGALTQFYLARLIPGDAGHTLTVSLFDIGDGGSTGTLTIVPPPDATISPPPPTGGSTVTLTGCTMQLGTGAAYTNVNGSGCQITGVSSASYGGKWLTIQVPIPAGYTCTVTTATNCWFRINYQFGGLINDTTSWTASLGGDPVRIVG